MSTSSTPPLWEDAPRPSYPDALPAPGHVDTLVVGGGLTGLTTALLLARAGVGVAVLEGRRIGSGTTGSSTAKVTLLQGTKLSRIRSRHPLGIARAYVDAQREGQAWLREFCEEHDVAFATRPAGTYAASTREVDSVRSELEALTAVGLPARWSDSLDLPCPVHGAVVLDEQVQLDPVELVHRLAEQVRSHGGTIHEGRRVRSVDQGERLVAQLDDGNTLTADRLVIATGAPTLTGWLQGGKVSASRSYVIALEGADSVPGMFISAGQPTRSVRTSSPRTAPELLLVGGSGHTVGRTRSESRHLDELRAWASEHFPGAVETHAWSAQDYGTPEELPMVGPLPGTDGRVHLASGYDKWGMTNAVAAARAISAELLGKPASWAETLRHRPMSPRSVTSLASLGLASGVAQVKGLVHAGSHPLPEHLPDGQGTLGRSGLRPAGLSNIDGSECVLSAVCTHVGGILRWNDREQTWDCPLHGSRFTPNGEVIEGPATKPLARLGDDHQPAGSGRPSA
ncbi:MAG TPA: FAD-dependent oxidoreductase [Marmoricola sp.]